MKTVTIHKSIRNERSEYLDIEADSDRESVSVTTDSKEGFRISTLEELDFIYDEIELLLMRMKEPKNE